MGTIEIGRCAAGKQELSETGFRREYASPHGCVHSDVVCHGTHLRIVKVETRHLHCLRLLPLRRNPWPIFAHTISLSIRVEMTDL